MPKRGISGQTAGRAGGLRATCGAQTEELSSCGNWKGKESRVTNSHTKSGRQPVWKPVSSCQRYPLFRQQRRPGTELPDSCAADSAGIRTAQPALLPALQPSWLCNPRSARALQSAPQQPFQGPNQQRPAQIEEASKSAEKNPVPVLLSI